MMNLPIARMAAVIYYVAMSIITGLPLNRWLHEAGIVELFPAHMTMPGAEGIHLGTFSLGMV